MEDELLAERIEVAGGAWLQGGRVPSLSELLSSVPVLRSRPIALDAAIDVVFKGLLAAGFSPEEAGSHLRADAPEFHEAIDAHMALRSLLGPSRPSEHSTSEPMPQLPAPFGPRIEDGRQRYEVVELVGSGSEGTVFRAFDRRLNADGRPLPVAIKRLHSRSHLAERQVAEEAGRAMRIRHSAIAALLDFGTVEDGPFLVYEFANGLSLERWRRQRKVVPARQAAEIVRQLAAAVQVAHNAGIVHRDLKPTNVLVDDGGAPCITDLGLAAALSSTSEGTPGGSLGFAAPEQLRGERGAADASVDVYALGGILFWLLTGRYPNGDSAKNIHANLSSNRFPGGEERTGLSRSERTLSMICSKALAPHPTDRYSSAGVLAEDLQRWLVWEPVLPFDRAAARRVSLAARRSPGAAGIVGLAVLAICLAVGAAWNFETHRRQAQLSIQQARVENQHRQLENAEIYTHGFINVLKETNAESGDAAWIPILSALEAITGEEMLGVTGVHGDIAEMRISVVTRLLNQAARDGTQDSIEMILWETARGYWLLHAERDEEAYATLRENVGRAERVLPAGDPWTIHARALYSIATIRVAHDPEAVDGARGWLANHGSALPEPLRKFIRVKTGVVVPEPEERPRESAPQVLGSAGPQSDATQPLREASSVQD